MPPVAEADPAADPANITEHYDGDTSYVPWGVRSFKDLAAAEEAEESSERVRVLAYQFKRLIENVLGDSTIAQKVPVIQAVADEFIGLVGEALGEVTNPTTEATAEASLAESISGAGAIRLIEEDAATALKGPRDPLIVDFALIKPGWGNKRDNHYYPADMLKRDAHMFEGAKMYTTDHVAGEKSERTEVSVIERIVNFAEDGTPIARAVVFDPDFAEKTRNRAKAGLLDSLHCSIFAKGQISQKTVDGKPAKVVEAILPDVRPSADWVTQAGAGGHALNLVESETGATPMNEDEKKPKTEETPAAPAAVPATPVAEATPPVTEPLTETQTPEPEPETFLAEADITAVFAERKLPAAVRLRLQAGKYASTEALNEAIENEIAYLKEVTASGKPLLLESAAPPAPASSQERERNVRQVLAHYR